MENMINIKSAAKYLGVTEQTLRNWESTGKLLPKRTPGGHRRYTIEMLDKVMNKSNL